MAAPSHPTDTQQWLVLALAQLAAAAPTETGLPGTALHPAHLGATPGAAAYCAALLDLLALIGVVELDPARTSVRAPSFVAGYCLRVLGDLAAIGAPLIADWADPDVIGPPAGSRQRGIDLLAALERRRLALVAEPQPLREVHAAVGLIGSRLASGEPALLVHWDDASARWQLLGGRYEARDGTLAQTLLRELAEELSCVALRAGVDVALSPLGAQFAFVRLSPTFGMLTATTFQAFTVQFLTALPALNPTHRWVSVSEIAAERTSDDQPIEARPIKHLFEHAAFDLARYVG
jgi:8-oxo-dGTP pyrophosphatase MutT (NUDIX family)